MPLPAGETQRLLLKIKSQLNPPDIISISIRKLIQDELEKVDQRLLLVSDRRDEGDSEDEDEGEDARIESESERAALASLLENFKTEMLDYSDQLVRYGLLKVKLQQLQTLETDLQSQLQPSTSSQQPAKPLSGREESLSAGESIHSQRPGGIPLGR
ncbi:hypothetical protein PGTUg99_025363 [Puccinia graminis f. sp. tritici]|uniref:Uncharacterized protein n=1 Tax=Puccinia graminis f. sp. tritici TaxID=56615 RepID=A0A5B0NX23_PUCGR|nr:hypothetical protein PGTUg99_033412 [Puccinia graminis f. sp. tritici]KAA1092387.1 hypothetical protein PGTUg99_025252 [Puccinia graminis f. sp. tritici]KAA1092389.1 hypothetical protein PGTUg99_025363 [Puccinia graminis f. sp. tritici]